MMFKDATFKTATPIEKLRYSPSDYNTVFVCTPVWSWNLCPPVRTWLRMSKGTIPRAVPDGIGLEPLEADIH